VADVPMLAKRAATKDDPDRESARRTLSRLIGRDVNPAIVAAMDGAETTVRVELIRSLASRCAKEALPVLQACAAQPDQEIRCAAIESIGALADETQVEAMVKTLRAAKSNEERAASERGLATVCRRFGDKCARPLIAGLDGADAPSRCALLRPLGLTGAAAALDALRKPVREEMGEVQTVAIKALSEWPDDRAAPDLLDLATKSESLQHHVLALRGYIRVVGAGKMKAPDKLAALKSALQLARRPEEKKQALGELGRVSTLPALELAATCLADEALSQEAAAAAVAIAETLKVSGADAGRTVAQAMDKVLEVTTSAEARKAATKVREKYRK
jgi:HEAT repeat protein